jgi:hypothetical protein
MCQSTGNVRQSAAGDKYNGVLIVDNLYLGLTAERSGCDEDADPTTAQSSYEAGNLIGTDGRVRANALGLT